MTDDRDHLVEKTREVLADKQEDERRAKPEERSEDADRADDRGVADDSAESKAPDEPDDP